ncbi:hypothetical protein FC093_17210 [Ilyomonas limi]|uniref:Heavy metal binding domain-containing protein n=1 Tax=Ilyomonas limi TaxID=2575867 RepID=A0A4V5UVV5_9BACT|nr:heavy metal-binding domain-containing protein [Ilyomonas limi]TKK66323.1 hypothetical protein FC093_17210 [Ilyomonas limi]
MKRVIILMLLVVCTATTFAQKSKADSAIKNSGTILVQYTCPMHPDVISDKQGKCPKCGMDLTLSKKEQMKREVTKTYTCPTHSELVSANPGNCPYCSAKLVVDRRGTKQGTVIYTCSMHPNVTVTKAGTCPICGMTLQVKTTQSDSSKIKQ